MHRNQFSHHYTVHQNNILRAKVDASGIEPEHLSSKGKCSGVFKGKKGHIAKALCLTHKWEFLMAPSCLI